MLKIKGSYFTLISNILILIFFCIIAFPGHFMMRDLDKQGRLVTEKSLKAILNSTNKSVHIWITEHIYEVGSWAQLPKLVNAVERQLKLIHDPEMLVNSDALRDLRAGLTDKLNTYEFSNFYVVSKNYFNIGSLYDEDIGKKNIIFESRVNHLQEVFLGKARFISPVKTDVIQQNNPDDRRGAIASIFIAVPIRDRSGSIIAILVIGMNTERGFSHFAQSGRIGESGETYFFDDQARLITESRFEDRLREINLLGADQSSIMNIEIRDPGGNLTEGYKPKLLRKNQPYTLMAQKAINNEDGSSIVPYNNYRGVPVFGAWVWDEDLGIGMTTEIDVNEAMIPVIRSTRIYILILGMMVLSFVVLFIMVNGLRTCGQKLLKKSEASLTDAQRIAKVGNWEWDIVKGTLHWSDEIYNIFGLKPQEFEATYEGFIKRVHPNDRQLVQDAVQQALDTKKPYSVYHKIILENGVIRYVHEQGEVWYDDKDSDKPIRMMGTVHDITELKEAENELRRYKEQLEELVRERTKELNRAKELAESSSRAKSAFLANMSHEIRTPMNSIIGFIELVLEMDNISDIVDNYLKTARTSARQLLALINDILDLSKLDADKLTLDNHKFYLPGVLDSVMNTFSVNLRKKSLAMSLELPADLYHCFIGDSNRLRQVLLNLIGNAVKFTNKGSIHVSVKKLNSDFLRFSVKDTGIGMTPEQVKEVFNSFSQADESTARRYGGTGLGTTICKQLVTKMGGEISVESVFGKGSTFSFTFPIFLPDCASDCDHRCNEYDENGSVTFPYSKRGFKILLAEDIEENSLIATVRLDQQGHDVFVVHDGIEAVEICKKQSFDLILMDVHMPGLDGLEATRQIRKLEENSSKYTPIIALTASIMVEERENYKKAGMDAVVGKPISFDKLFNIMERVVPEGVGKPIESFSYDIGEEEKMVIPMTLDGIDFNEGLNHWQNKPVYIYALDKFVEKHSNTTEELLSAINEENVDNAYFISHALKGVAANLFLKDVHNIAIKVEKAIANRKLEDAKLFIPALSDAIKIAIASIRGLRAPEIIEAADNAEELVSLIREQLVSLRRGEVNDKIFSEVIDKLQGQVRVESLEQLRESVHNFEFNDTIEKLELIIVFLESRR